MRFESIEIKNYRQYQNVFFKFDKNTANDIHVIIASNGVGKTNILNAVNWCLYGDEPHTSGTDSDVSTDKLPLCNLKAVDETKSRSESFCEVAVTIVASEQDEVFTFSRTAKMNVDTLLQIGKDSFEVKEKKSAGNTVIHSGDEAREKVNMFLPKKIREYFYFDGEKLLNYFDPKKNTVHIKDSIQEIAQVNIINKVETHLADFAKQYDGKLRKLSPQLEEKSKAVEELKQKIENTKIDIANLEKQIEEATRTIGDMDKIINGTESVVEDNKRYDRNQEEIKNYENKIAIAKKELSLFVRKYLILVYLYETNKKTEQYILSKAEDGSMDPGMNMDMIRVSLEQHECKICGNQLNKAAEEYLQGLVDKFMSSAVIRQLSEIKNDISRGLKIFDYEKEKEALYDKIDELELKREELIAENDELYKRISTVTQIDDIEKAMSRKKDCEDSRDINNQKIGSYKQAVSELQKQLDKADEEYENAKNENKNCEELKEKYDFVKSAEKIVADIKKEIVDAVKAQMEQLTMEIFESLCWKKNTYGRIQLDDNFRLKLFHKQTGLSCLNSCSAAEKELLALAFTIALHKVSGYDNLLFIDTPVGRVSDVNRENFGKILLEISDNKQIILAFTPSEYSDEISSVLNSAVVSTVNKLETDEETTAVQEV